MNIYIVIIILIQCLTKAFLWLLGIQKCSLWKRREITLLVAISVNVDILALLGIKMLLSSWSIQTKPDRWTFAISNTQLLEELCLEINYLPDVHVHRRIKFKSSLRWSQLSHPDSHFSLFRCFHFCQPTNSCAFNLAPVSATPHTIPSPIHLHSSPWLALLPLPFSNELEKTLWTLIFMIAYEQRNLYQVSKSDDSRTHHLSGSAISARWIRSWIRSRGQ